MVWGPPAPGAACRRGSPGTPPAVLSVLNRTAAALAVPWLLALRAWGEKRLGSGSLDALQEGHGGPTGSGEGAVLRLPVRETGIEVVVRRNGALVHEPGTVLLLRPQQEVDAPLIVRVGQGNLPSLVQREQRLPRGVGITA